MSFPARSEGSLRTRRTTSAPKASSRSAMLSPFTLRIMPGVTCVMQQKLFDYPSVRQRDAGVIRYRYARPQFFTGVDDLPGQHRGQDSSEPSFA